MKYHEKNIKKSKHKQSMAKMRDHLSLLKFSVNHDGTALKHASQYMKEGKTERRSGF